MKRRYLFLLFWLFSYLPVLAQMDTAWVRRYNGPGNGGDVAYELAVDDGGNVYVTGSVYVSGPGNSDYATIKYAPNGDTLWVRRYNGPANGPDQPYALAVDDSGNVYVTGNSSSTSAVPYIADYATIKYSPNGDTLWVRRYNGPGNYLDIAAALVVDDSGYVYVTGGSYGSGTAYDFATIKYAPNGNTLWVRRYNGPPGNNIDGGAALAVDGSGNLYVTGNSIGSGTGYDYFTIKYAPNGDTLWARRYNAGNGADNAYALAVDGSGNAYVTGESDPDADQLNYNNNYATIKYAPNGDTLWVRRYNGSGSGPGNAVDRAKALVVDGSGNLYVTGVSVESVTGNDYTTIKYAPNGDTLWVRHYTGPPGNGVDDANALALDGSGNLYVTGASYSATWYDYATIKYDPNGDTLWVGRYNGPVNGHDQAFALALDGSGNLYVTGYSAGSGTAEDYATIKYSPSSACQAARGDMNGDGGLSPADVVLMLNCVFLGSGNCASCFADANCDGSLSPADVVLELNAVFLGASLSC